MQLPGIPIKPLPPEMLDTEDGPFWWLAFFQGDNLVCVAVIPAADLRDAITAATYYRIVPSSSKVMASRFMNAPDGLPLGRVLSPVESNYWSALCRALNQ